MGTPDFAVPSLNILYEAGFEIVGVVTSPDKYGGRGRKTVIESAVKKYAVSKGLKVLQPVNLKSTKFNKELDSLKADIHIVVAFRMLPEIVWNKPPLGTYNLHGSLLPKYRGAAPINWAIIKGEKKTGVSFFKLKHEIDTGSILLQNEIPIQIDDNATSLHDRMMIVGAESVLEGISKIESGDYSLISQDDDEVSHAPKLTKENTRINFNEDVHSIHNFIRGLSLYPGAWFLLGDQPAKVFSSEIQLADHSHKPGKLLSDNKSYIKIASKNGYIMLKDIKYPGKKSMEVREFLNGFDVEKVL